MKKGKRLKLLPFTVLITALSFTVYVPGILLMQTTERDLSIQIQDIEREISELEEANDQLNIEVEQLKRG
jgi:cell division protein FtsL